MTGHQIISAPRARVWEALNDPRVLARCIPGCQRVDRVSEAEFSVESLAKVGPVRARFTGRVLMEDVVPGLRCRIGGEGGGGPAGFARGAASVELADVEGGTRLEYHVDASVGGKVAQVGARLIDATAKKMADEFFSEFCKAVTGPSGESTAVDDSVLRTGGGADMCRPPFEDRIVPVEITRRAWIWWASLLTFIVGLALVEWVR